MDLCTSLLMGSAVAAGFYMAWNIGANDVANSMSTAIGARALTLKQVIIIAGILEFAGAVLVGSHVTETIRKGILDNSIIGNPQTVALGALSALLGASIWITLSTWKELPVSTTHSVVGGLWGFGLVLWIRTGEDPIQWFTLGRVFMSWILSPLAGAFIAFLVFKGITYFIFNSKNPIKSTRIYGPVLIGATFFIISTSLLTKTNLGRIILGEQNTFSKASLLSLPVFAMGYLAGYLVIKYKLGTVESDNYLERIEGMFRKLQIITSCYVAFAHGANDVANAIGPVAVVINYIYYGTVGATVEVSPWILSLGGLGIVVGISTWGYKVMKTVAFKITKLTNTRGFSVDFGAATTVLIASKFGMPISTTHTVVGAVVGVGMARGLEAVNLSVIKDIVYSWAFTLPVAAGTSAGIYMLLTTFI